MYSDAVIRHALALERAGSAGPGAAWGEAGDATCGDAVRIELDVEGTTVTRARHRSRACPHATAAVALACGLADGRDLLDAARLGAGELEQVLRPAAHNRACVTLAADALHAALARALATVALEPVPDRVAVAMSGGVDSAVALLKVVEAGLEPVGVTLRLWIDPQAPDSERACCSPRSVRAARDTCHALGVPHVTLDLRDQFRSDVVDDFVAGHRAGLTPNPCVRCNGSFRFAALAAFADRIGARRLATGHYARIERRDGRALVARAADRDKDQSYMLARVPLELLERVWFPLGDQDKRRTRAEAARAGMAAAAAPESQDVCFVGGGDHRGFLERHGGEGRSGAIVDAAGRALGSHGGVHRFTPGQRRGIGLGGGRALYVLRSDPGSGTVVVGHRDQLARRCVRVRPGALYVAAERVEAKLRYRSPARPASVRPLTGGFELVLDDPAHGVAPGQAAVLYDGDGVVVGAGLVSR